MHRGSWLGQFRRQFLPGFREVSLVEIERDVVIVACAISAGIHAALVPGHFEEGAGSGSGFLAATVLLAPVVAGLSRRPASLVWMAAAGTVLGGLLAGYAFAATTGLPLLHQAPEPIAGLALVTKAIESLGLIAALHLSGHRRTALAASVIHTEGVQT